MIKNNEYIIHDNFIEYKFYNLYFSSLHKNCIVTLDRINAINLKTSPHSLIIDNKEIIFLNHNDTNSLESFALKNNIAHSTHIDTWSILMRDYLDTQFDHNVIEKQDKQLEQIGINKMAFEKISEDIKWTMFGIMEWSYIGLWDLLATKQYRNPFYILFGRKYYWKVMNIALKGSEYVSEK